MRYLLIGIALLAMTASFAAQTASTVVTLTITDYCAITADAAAVGFTAAGNAGSATKAVGFKYDSNNTGTITPSIVDNTPTAGLVWSTGSPVVAVAGSVAAPVSFNADVNGITPAILAGSYNATLTATISIP
jgi:hypothetical protein